MSVGSTVDPQAPPWLDLAQGEAAGGTPEQLAAETVSATRDEIRQLASEIAELARKSVPAAEFHAEFLRRVVSALASVAGAVWLLDADGAARVAAQVNLDGVLPAEAEGEHHRILRHTITANTPQSIPPQFAAADKAWSNPTGHLLILVPLQVDDRVMGVVEVFQRANRGPATERGYARFLMHMGDLAGGYLKSQCLRQLSDRHAWSGQLEAFLVEIHRTLSVRRTGFAVVNEARRVLGCDRVSLALGTGRHCRVTTVSGLDNVDRRAEQVRRMGRLAARVLKTRETIWLTGSGEDLPPQIEVEWSRYTDISHNRRCGVLPLLRTTDGDDGQKQGEPLGALIVEQLLDVAPDGQLEQRAGQIARHSSAALRNSLDHERVFLLPLWRALGSICDSLCGRHFPKTLLIVVLFVMSAVALVTVQSEFTVPVRGTLQPTVRRTVFSREDGVIVQVPVEHGQAVKAGQVLVQMRNTDLEVEITSLVGKQTTIHEQILSIQRALLDNPHLDVGQQNRLSGELLQLRQEADSIQRQLELVRKKEQQLAVRSDQAGQVVTWHVRDKLLHRPVQKGQELMAIVDPDEHWELELYVPERHFGHVHRAASESGKPLPVTFALSSHTGYQFEGTLVEVDRVAIAREEYGNTVRIRVAIDKRELPELRSDASVVAKVHCGQCAIGYTWFHDLFDTVQAKVLFWL